MYKMKPCAYCGLTDSPREKGHIIPVCMYPSDTDPRIQRRSVPECSECKKIWQDAENQFRNVMVIAGTPNSAVMEQWEGPLKRSFNKPSGRKWARALVEQMVALENTEGPLHKIYPANNPEVMLVIRKIIRGLCHYHGIATAVSDQRVWADIQKYQIPPYLKENMKWFHIGPKLLEYAYEFTNDRELNIHSAWYLRFYEEREFVSFIVLSEDIDIDKFLKA
jgi:hypothetical protein